MERPIYLALALCALGTWSCDAALGATYKNSEHGYEVSLPDGWRVDAGSAKVAIRPLEGRDMEVAIQVRPREQAVDGRWASRFLRKKAAKVAKAEEGLKSVKKVHSRTMGASEAWGCAVTSVTAGGQKRLRYWVVGSGRNPAGETRLALLTASLPAVGAVTWASPSARGRITPVAAKLRRSRRFRSGAVEKAPRVHCCSLVKVSCSPGASLSFALAGGRLAWTARIGRSTWC